jgi:type IX secretion system PorP/SprF family membrane protein
MTIKKIIILLSTFMLTYSALGQQDPQFSQNMFNQMTINPGYAGSHDMVCATALNKLQWVGFGEGSPSTTAVNINAAIAPFGFKSGVGLDIISDNIGFNKDLGLNITYAARFKVDQGMLGVGLSGGFMNNSIDPKWKFPNSTPDATIPLAKESSINFDLGFGLFYNTEAMYVGLSATHLNETKINKATNPAHYTRHYYLTGGYLLNLPNPAWQLNPSIFVATDLVDKQFTLNTNVVYNKKFWGGVSYRIGEAITGMVGVELFNGLKIGYAYDFTLGKISKYNDGSHEFMLGYCFSLKKEKPPQQYKSIRFL